MSQTDPGSSRTALERVVDRAHGHLQDLGYCETTLRDYRQVWMKVIAFSRQDGLSGSSKTSPLPLRNSLDEAPSRDFKRAERRSPTFRQPLHIPGQPTWFRAFRQRTASESR